MIPLVEFCANNIAAGSKSVYQTLERDINVDVVVYDCLAYCDLCATCLFALVDGEIVSGKNANDLCEKIYACME